MSRHLKRVLFMAVADLVIARMSPEPRPILSRRRVSIPSGSYPGAEVPAPRASPRAAAPPRAAAAAVGAAAADVGACAVRWLHLDPDTATASDVQAVFRDRAKRNHPDHGGTSDMSILVAKRDAALAYVARRDDAAA
jgi:hypothetical protein